MHCRQETLNLGEQAQEGLPSVSPHEAGEAGEAEPSIKIFGRLRLRGDGISTKE